jgi:ubiquinone/menaquinone biosynthesis C-methylase UbiE
MLPRPIARYVKHFEAVVEDAVRDFAGSLPEGARVLDAGAGEGQYKRLFARHRYLGFDLGVGDHTWNYSGLDVRGDLAALPFGDGSFDAAISIVTLEHVRDPAGVLGEMARTLRPGGVVLVAAPHQWEEHQQPHDYFRYTRHGLQYLLEQAGFMATSITPVGGIFRLLSRRLLTAWQYLPPGVNLLFLALAAAPALALPLLDRFDQRRNSTLGYICCARKPS